MAIAITAPVAFAQAQTVNTAQGFGATRTSSAVRFDIPTQALDSALSMFSAATGIQLIYDSGATYSLRSASVHGVYEPAEGLARLLAPTGLSPRFTGPRMATLQRGGALNSHAQAVGGTITLDTIEVSGEKTTRDYFRTYSSIGVVTGQEISDYNVPDLKRSFDLLGNVRSFPARNGNHGFVIRGLNSEGVTQPSNGAPVISVVVDGAIQNVEATRRGARGVWDVEQVEVLRGPQSTLQGRNALGGAVVVKSKDPTWVPEGVVEGQLGQQEFRTGAFAISTPIVPDQVAIRIAGQKLRETKDITYTDPAAAKLAEDELDQLRAKLLVAPKAMPGLSALFTVSRTLDQPAVNGVTGPDFFARHFDSAIGGASVEFRRAAVNNYIADISYDLGTGLKLQSVTSFTKADVSINTPPGGTLDRNDTRKEESYAQDLRFSFDRPGSPLSGVVGLFAGRFPTNIDSLILAPGFGGITVQDAIFDNETVSLAAYADFRYRFADRWTLLAGGRVAHDKITNKATGISFDMINFVNVPLAQDMTTSYTVFLPKAGLAYDLTSNQTVAATLSRGYRAGFSEVVLGSGALSDVAPEFLWSYELAYRSKWFDDRLQLNANLFYYDYRNQQLPVDNPFLIGATSTASVGKSHAYGAEVEARARVTEPLTIFASVGLLKAKFDEAVTSTATYSGNSFPEAPAVTASVGGMWKDRSGFFAGADMSYTDGFYSTGDLANTPNRYVESFVLVNARLGYETKYGSLTVFARNLLDKQYLTSIDTNATQATIGDGRMFGVKGTARF